MRFEIKHRMDYSYTKEVFLEPMTIRLRPRDDFSQRVESFSMEASPSPSGCSDSLDLFNNPQTTLWFSNPQARWSVETRFRVETLVTNPFNFLVTDELALRLPAKYGAERLRVLAPYLFRPAPDKAVENLANDLLRESDGNTLNFLYNAADFLSREIRYVIRPQGDPLAPPKTLQRKEGACRDTAVLFYGYLPVPGIGRPFCQRLQIRPGRRGQQGAACLRRKIYTSGGRLAGIRPEFGARGGGPSYCARGGSFGSGCGAGIRQFSRHGSAFRGSSMIWKFVFWNRRRPRRRDENPKTIK